MTHEFGAVLLFFNSYGVAGRRASRSTLTPRKITVWIRSVFLISTKGGPSPLPSQIRQPTPLGP
jgi:hypothetical protein